MSRFLCYTDEMIRHCPARRFLGLLSLILLLLSDEVAANNNAPRLLVGVGTNLTFWQILGNISAFLAASIVAISTAMFVVGAVLVMASGVKEDLRQRGKDFLIGSALGIIVVLGAYALFRTVNCFLTPGCLI